MNLLIIKNDTEYIRKKDNIITTCAMNKASVFPINQRIEAENILAQTIQAGFKNAELYKLTITEEKA